jgi:YVTN family beta-propeller protein
VIDPSGKRIMRTFPVGRRPWGIALTPDGRTLVTANGASDDVSIVEAATGKIIGTVKAGRGPWGVAITK